MSQGQIAHMHNGPSASAICRHAAQHMVKQQLSQSVSTAIGVAGGNRDWAIAEVVGELIQLRYSREDELEADSFALRYTEQASYDPSQMLRVMQILKKSVGSGRGPGIFATHPDPDARIEQIRGWLSRNFRAECRQGSPGATRCAEQLVGALPSGSKRGENAPMARLSDVPKVLRAVGPYTFLKRVVHEISDDDLLTWAAALAYSWLFAAFPFLLFLLSLLAFLPENTKASVGDQVYSAVYNMPKQAADIIWMNVNEILNHRRTGVLSVGLILAIWSASGGMSMTLSALDRCYELKEGRSLYKHRLVSLVLTIVVAILLILVLLLLPIGSIAIAAIQKYGMSYVSRPLLWTWKLARLPLGLAAMLLIVNVLYHFGPAIKQRFTLITPGGVFCIIIWIGLGLLLRLYVEKFSNFNQTYGTVGGVAIMLLVFYADAVVLLVGAEINSEIDFAVLGVQRGTHDFTAAKQSGSEG